MKSILLKLSGELFNTSEKKKDGVHTCMDSTFVHHIIEQIKQLHTNHRISIVIGGGNFFRGCKEGKQLGITATTADAVGMLATVMNGLLLNDLCRQAGIQSKVLAAHAIPGIVNQIHQTEITLANTDDSITIFVGGTGNPFFSTDTAAILRALQVNAREVWKATNVDYLYDQDPHANQHAQPILKTTYAEVLSKKLKIMDLTAITLAQEHNITLRIFNIFKENALLNIANNDTIGSTVVA